MLVVLDVWRREAHGQLVVIGRLQNCHLLALGSFGCYWQAGKLPSVRGEGLAVTGEIEVYL